MDPLLRAAAFAARKHARQRRKNAAADPYINHPIEVAELLSRHGVADPATLQAALLHDTVEDTETTPEELEAEFGPEVRAVVLECTDDKTLSKAERKRLQIARAPHKSHRAQLVKLADKTANIRQLAIDPPVDWPPERVRAYLDWAEAVVAGLRGAHPGLAAEFDAALAANRAALAAAEVPRR